MHKNMHTNTHMHADEHAYTLKITSFILTLRNKLQTEFKFQVPIL